MNHFPDDGSEGSPLLRAWRAKAFDVVLVLLAIMTFPLVVMVLFHLGIAFPWYARATAFGAFLALVVAAWRRDWRRRWRAVLVFGAGYSLTVVKWTTSGLSGSGRMSLLVLPILALILLGNRAGWLATGFSAAVFGGFVFLAATGSVTGLPAVGEDGHDPGFWLLQGLVWLAAVIPLMTLLTLFQNLNLKALAKERLARRKVETAAAEQRRLEQEVAGISEAERRRVGMDLHDGLCQQLTAALLHCTSLERDLSARQAPEAKVAGPLRGLIEGCMDSAYAAAKGLCPVDLDTASLVPALQRLGSQISKETGIVCELKTDGMNGGLDPTATVHLYRVAQEAVQNAAKHAHCRRIVVEWRGAPDAWVLSVSDDGQQGAPTAGVPGGGLGARIMQYRAATIGGTLSIEHPPEGGTRVVCWVPRVPPAASPAPSLVPP